MTTHGGNGYGSFANGGGGGGGSSAGPATCAGSNGNGSNGGGGPTATCDGDVCFVSDELRTFTLTLPPGRTGRVKSVTVVDDTTTFEIELDPPKAAVCPCGINRQDCEYHR